MEIFTTNVDLFFLSGARFK